MQEKTPSTICPHCGSREFWPSRKRLPESLLGPLLPYRPFRCRACLKRYLVAKPWAWASLAAAVLLAAGLGLLHHFGGLDLPAAPRQIPAAAPPPEPEPPPPARPPEPQPVPETPDSLLFRVQLNIPPAAGGGKTP